jgi:hypothetical protein
MLVSPGVVIYRVKNKTGGESIDDPAAEVHSTKLPLYTRDLFCSPVRVLAEVGHKEKFAKPLPYNFHPAANRGSAAAG